MVWSLSQDDDGLESLGSSDGFERTPVRSAPPPPRPPAPPSSKPQPFSPRSGATPHSAVPGSAPSSRDPGSSVIVDPISQVPEQRAPGSRPKRRHIEPTLVLKGRQLDQLRDDMLRKRREHERRKKQILAFWVLAGAAAVAIGALLAQTLSGPIEAQPVEHDLDQAAESAPEEAADVVPPAPQAAARQEAVLAPPSAAPPSDTEPVRDSSRDASPKDAAVDSRPARDASAPAPTSAAESSDASGTISWDELPNESDEGENELSD